MFIIYTSNNNPLCNGWLVVTKNIHILKFTIHGQYLCEWAKVCFLSEYFINDTIFLKVRSDMESSSTRRRSLIICIILQCQSKALSDSELYSTELLESNMTCTQCLNCCTIQWLIFADIKFQGLEKIYFTLNRPLCEQQFEDKQAVSSGIKLSYNFED